MGGTRTRGFGHEDDEEQIAMPMPIYLELTKGQDHHEFDGNATSAETQMDLEGEPFQNHFSLIENLQTNSCSHRPALSNLLVFPACQFLQESHITPHGRRELARGQIRRANQQRNYKRPREEPGAIFPNQGMIKNLLNNHGTDIAEDTGGRTTLTVSPVYVVAYGPHAPLQKSSDNASPFEYQSRHRPTSIPFHFSYGNHPYVPIDLHPLEIGISVHRQPRCTRRQREVRSRSRSC